MRTLRVLPLGLCNNAANSQCEASIENIRRNRRTSSIFVNFIPRASMAIRNGGSGCGCQKASAKTIDASDSTTPTIRRAHLQLHNSSILCVDSPFQHFVKVVTSTISRGMLASLTHSIISAIVTLSLQSTLNIRISHIPRSGR